MKPLTLAFPLLACITLAGCATEYSCPMPTGDGGCRSVAQVNQDTETLVDTMTPSAGGTKGHGSDSKDDAMTRVMVAAAGAAPLQPTGPGDAVLSTPRVLRVYVLPWQDTDGDLESGGYIYLRLDKGQWTISQKQ